MKRLTFLMMIAASLNACGNKDEPSEQAPVVRETPPETTPEPVVAPSGPEAPAPVAARHSEEPAAPVRYTVKPGDTLYGIAKRHGLSYQDLARWNDIPNPALIKPGQELSLSPQGR